MKHLRFLVLQLGFLMFSLSLVPGSGNCMNAYTSFDMPAEKQLSNTDTVLLNLKFRLDSFSFQTIDIFNGVQFYLEGIIFLDDSKKKHRMFPDHLSFGALDTYYAPISGQDSGKHELFSKKNHFPYPSEATSFANNYQTIFFTKYSQTGTNERIPKIYKTHYINSENPKKAGWSPDFKELAFCKDSYSYIHPAVSYDGKIMIFSTNRPSGKGKFDLFMVRQNKSGWTDPLNLGSNVNTRDNEQYPFLDSHNNLFFSSDRQTGYGGYDIYVSSFNGKGWDKPVNLGAIVNSINDETSFKISRKNDTIAFFVSKPDSVPKIAQLHKAFVFDSTMYPIFREALASTKTIVAPSKPIQVIEEKKPAIIVPVKTSPPPVKPAKKEIIVVVPPPKKEVVKEPNAIVFRVQILASMKPRGNIRVTIDNKVYLTKEYFYKGAYRSTIGKFNTVDEALQFKAKCRKAGFIEAFVAAFKDNIRETDPKVFRR